MNALLNEEKAIVSDIAGTTRDVIEDELVIRGVKFRFVDTAGIRQTEDRIERIGVERAYQQVDKASVIIYLIDPTQESAEEALQGLKDLETRTIDAGNSIIPVVNKSDKFSHPEHKNSYSLLPNVVYISAKEQLALDLLLDQLFELAGIKGWEGESMLVTNARHASALEKAENSLKQVLDGLSHLTTDLLALELKAALHHLGEITGEIYTDDLLGNIFSKFCIGK